VSTGISSELFRKLPSTDDLFRQAEIEVMAARNGRTAVTAAIRVVIDRLRQEIAEGRLDTHSKLELALADLPSAIERQLRHSLRNSLRLVINGTGVILHTNLGRAPLAAEAIKHINQIAAGYSNLEFDEESGARGTRDTHVDRLFQRLFDETPAEYDTRMNAAPASRRASRISTIVVNNNAAAVLLALNSIAEGGEVIVSRGELVEIGGSFRIPDVMAKSQATLREVGTTNRTRLADYEGAINERTRLLLRVHRSNFAITGFTEQPTLAELVGLARRRNLPLMEDLGSGALFDLRSIGIEESGVLDSLRAGVDLVTYSGDKLLGGPQAGLITGRTLVGRLRSNSLFRALRVDKLTYAALEGTLLAYLRRDYDAIPALRMMRLSKDEIESRAETIVARIVVAGQEQASAAVSPDSPGSPVRRDRGCLHLELIDGKSLIGGGAAPTAVLPTCLIGLTHRELSADDLCARLRRSNPPVIARVEDGRVLLDLRTVFPDQETTLVASLAALCN
jgi:L-seryl-tRNA(Ser) seleniumtransferase